ncbi:MAG: GNAT family N-acetyltransferase [Ruminococcus sp.]|nr:GNAT family N-acetyltransferase [Ruminococcus sp.]
MKVTYRRAVPADIPVIERLFADMLASVGDDETEGYESGYLDKFFGGGDVIYVAVSDGEVVGYISVEVYPDYVYLDDLSVTEAFRGMGIGTKLIKFAERYAADSSVSSAALHVERTNTAARYLYQRLGYAVTDEDESRLKMTKHIRKGRTDVLYR